MQGAEKFEGNSSLCNPHKTFSVKAHKFNSKAEVEKFRRNLEKMSFEVLKHESSK